MGVKYARKRCTAAGSKRRQNQQDEAADAANCIRIGNLKQQEQNKGIRIGSLRQQRQKTGIRTGNLRQQEQQKGIRIGNLRQQRQKNQRKSAKISEILQNARKMKEKRVWRSSKKVSESAI